MAKFVPIKTDGPEVSIEVFNRLQQAIAQALEPDIKSLQIHVVSGQYRCTESDDIVIADPVGGPVKIIVQIPEVKQRITIMNKSGTSGNPVTVQRIDGKPFDQAGSVLAVDKLTSIVVACDGHDWEKLF